MAKDEFWGVIGEIATPLGNVTRYEPKHPSEYTAEEREEILSVLDTSPSASNAITILECEERADPQLRGELTITETISGVGFDIYFGYGNGEEIDVPKSEIPRIIEFLEKLR